MIEPKARSSDFNKHTHYSKITLKSHTPQSYNCNKEKHNIPYMEEKSKNYQEEVNSGHLSLDYRFHKN